MSPAENPRENVGNDDRSRWPAIAAILLSILALGLAVSANGWKEDLKIGEVTVQGNRILSSETIIGLSGLHKKERMFGVDLFQVQKRLLQHQFIRSASVRRETPGRITVSVVERAPVAAISSGTMEFMDDEGYLLPPLVSDQIFDIPIITGTFSADDLVPGRQTRSPKLLSALSVILAMQAVGEVVYRNISEVHIVANGEIVLYTTEGAVPVYIGLEDFGKKLVSLEAFWNQVAMRGDVRNLEYIDLRYDGQVVARWKGATSSTGSVPAARRV
jgi:cell division protein FtsQ